ncbi:MAG: metallophosphatase [Dysgonamonadaceae bacterium]|nr:metallophosphatase [Dysgonamonadaceae bacterium]
MTELKLKNRLIILLLAFPLLLAAQDKSLIILHLNDTHSRIEPYDAASPTNANKGGVIRQDAYIREVRNENPENILIFHCGDFVQGTPYFNLFKGETEMAVANELKTDAACLGNHEFDNGIAELAKMVRKANFPFIASNLDFTGTPMEGLTKEYLIIKRNGLKIGVLGLTVSPEGLVSKHNSEGMKYLDPVESANRVAKFLKEKKKCDLVICLSHLGYFPAEDRIGDITVAKQSRNIDIILGGHTHTFLVQPDRRQNLDGKEVVINQAGANGIYVGSLDVEMERVK